MEDFITRPIGEKFDYEGDMLEVAMMKNGLCKGCYFYGGYINCKNREVRNTIGYCSPFSRNDGKNVIFKDVE